MNAVAHAVRCEVTLELHPRQEDAFLTPATEVLYGGAAGGGKSHLMRAAAVAWCTEIAGLQVYLFRRVSSDLVKNHIEGPKGLRAMLAPWTAAGLVRIVEDEIRFWNGSKIYLCHCEEEKHRYKYQGAEIHVLLIDELTTFTEVIYRFLRGRVRAPGLNLPKHLAGLFPRILCGSNPGNVGHHWVKEAFLPHQPSMHMQLRQMPDEEGGMLRQYIPARLDDNPTMAEDDPRYRSRLRGLGSPALVRAMEEGDWGVVAGAFFEEFSLTRHVIKPFEIPPHWSRYRAGDWGSAKPFSIGWYAVSDGEPVGPHELVLPRGALVRYREWYGMRPGQANVGLKLTAESVADGIKEREAPGEVIEMGVLDPSAFAQNGGPSIAERMADRGIYFHRADNARVGSRGALGGWDLLRERLVGTAERDERTGEVLWGPDDQPMIYFFDTCVHAIRTLPALQHDDLRPEDVDSDSEDHAPDEIRYACSARPWVKDAPTKPKPRWPTQQTFTELIAAQRRKRLGE